MVYAYSVYDAKAKLSEALRLVKANKRVVITEHGRRVAELIPYQSEEKESLEDRLVRLESEGVLKFAKRKAAVFRPLGKRPGALRRFLDSRD